MRIITTATNETDFGVAVLHIHQYVTGKLRNKKRIIYR